MFIGLGLPITRVGKGGPVLGPELVVNGDFAVDANWTKGTGWTITSGAATKAAGSGSDIKQAVTLVAGVTYQATYTITRSAGAVGPQFTGGTVVSGVLRAASGTYTENLVAVTGNTSFEFNANSSFVGTVDNVSLKSLT